MSAVTWGLEADFDRDGTFSTDLTGYVEAPGAGVSIDRGSDRVGEPQASTLSVGLANRSGAFNPRNLSSPFTGLLQSGWPVRVIATHAAVEYTAWTGYARQVVASKGSAGAVSMAELEALSRFGFLREAPPVYLAASSSRDTDGAISAIASAAGMSPATDLDLWDGKQDLEWHFVAGQDPLTALLEAAASELGGPIYELANNAIRFESRDARQGVSQFERLMRRYMQTSVAAGRGFWLRNNEFSGTTVYDRTGNGCNGTLVGTVTLGAAGIGDLRETTLQLDGAGGHVTIADANALDVGDSFTLGMLLHLDTLPVGTDDDVLFRRAGWGDLIIEADDDKLTFSHETGGGVRTAIARSSIALTAATSYLIVVAKSGATTAIYVNGVDVTSAGTNVAFGDQVTAFYVGNWSSGSYTLPARVGDTWLADDTWTATQVANLYAATSGYSWGDGTSMVPSAWEAVQDEGDIATKVEVRANNFLEGQDDIVVFEFSQNMFTRPTSTAMALTAGQVWEREVDIRLAYTSLTATVANTDYMADSAIDGSGTDKTSALDVTVTDLGNGRARIRLENTDAATIYVLYFQIRATPLDLFADRPIATVSKALSDHPTGRALSFDIPFFGGSHPNLLALAVSELRISRYPVERLALTFYPHNDTARAEFLGLELGDLVYYDDTALAAGTGAYVKDWYYVEGISHKVPPNWAGQTWECQVRLVPTYNWRDIDRTVFDDFARDNASGDLGTSASAHAWANDGNMDIASGAARANSDTVQMPNLDLGALAFDQVVEVSLAAIGAGDEVGVVFRYVDADNQYRCYLDKGSNELILEKNVGGVVTEITSPAFTVGTAHELRVIVQRDRIRAWVDHAFMFDVSDAAQNTGTKCGLFARNANGTTTFDDFYGAAL